jgi:flagellar biosynthesis chaperone FliJ
MAVSAAMRRLLRVRELEEEQRKTALEGAMGELHRLEQALSRARLRGRAGRRLVTVSAKTGEAADRLAGLAESAAGEKHGAYLVPRITEAEERVAELREEFLVSRVERRQAETLIAEAEARAMVVTGRREQQALDDRFGVKRQRKEG